MGKIVKYCGSCEEGFAEKFGFCPDCGAPLQAFEMNPVTGSPAVDATPEGVVPATVDLQAQAASTEQFESSDIANNGNGFAAVPDDVLTDETDSEQVEEIAAAVTEEIPEYADTDYVDEFDNAVPKTEPSYTFDSDSVGAHTSGENNYGDYHITVIEEKNVRQRNELLLGATALMIVALLAGTVYSLFNKDLGVGAIDQGSLFAFVPEVEEVPMEVEEEPKKDKDDGGGGGGGGRDEETPTSKGQLASQTEKPLINPTKTIVQKDFELQQPIAATQGNRIMPRTDQPYGDPNSRFGLPSDGTGSGGGQGSGYGQGQGSGRGTGMGSGTGSGSGSGDGDGNGDGRGSGSGRNIGAPPPRPAGVTQKFRLIAKPKATYTDPARQNSVQGNVTLRVQLLASGQVGSITPVSRLPYGLTEQAIAAARQIRFEPAKRDGVPVTTTVTFQYSFTIY